jgi:hypothetical protein
MTTRKQTARKPAKRTAADDYGFPEIISDDEAAHFIRSGDDADGAPDESNRNDLLDAISTKSKITVSELGNLITGENCDRIMTYQGDAPSPLGLNDSDVLIVEKTDALKPCDIIIIERDGEFIVKEYGAPCFQVEDAVENIITPGEIVGRVRFVVRSMNARRKENR